jgi:hypothetical protein
MMLPLKSSTFYFKVDTRQTVNDKNENVNISVADPEFGAFSAEQQTFTPALLLPLLDPGLTYRIRNTG